MEQATHLRPAEAPAEIDLLAAIQEILRASNEPMTLSKIRAQLPARLRSLTPDELSGILAGPLSAKILYQYPKYRSQQDRFWDRPMPFHVNRLLLDALGGGALPWSELRRKLPGYAQAHAETALEEQLRKGALYRHPRFGRSGERFGLRPADPKDYLRGELIELFRRLEPLGFPQPQLREAALELLHEDEWSGPPSGGSDAPPAGQRPQTTPAEEPANELS